jgi:hypothetical protein
MFGRGCRRCQAPRRSPPPTECHGNIAPPGQAGVVAGRREKDTRSGSEHGSTVASTVVAPWARRISGRTFRFSCLRTMRIAVARGKSQLFWENVAGRKGSRSAATVCCTGRGPAAWAGPMEIGPSATVFRDVCGRKTGQPRRPWQDERRGGGRAGLAVTGCRGLQSTRNGAGKGPKRRILRSRRAVPSGRHASGDERGDDTPQLRPLRPAGGRRPAADRGRRGSGRTRPAARRTPDRRPPRCGPSAHRTRAT